MKTYIDGEILTATDLNESLTELTEADTTLASRTTTLEKRFVQVTGSAIIWGTATDTSVIVSGSTVVTLNANGEVLLTHNQNLKGIGSIVICSGDAAAAMVALALRGGGSDFSKDAFWIKAQGIASRAIRVNYVLIGWR